jgi:hypothetical protein
MDIVFAKSDLILELTSMPLPVFALFSFEFCFNYPLEVFFSFDCYFSLEFLSLSPLISLICSGSYFWSSESSCNSFALFVRLFEFKVVILLMPLSLLAGSVPKLMWMLSEISYVSPRVCFPVFE